MTSFGEGLTWAAVSDTVARTVAFLGWAWVVPAAFVIAAIAGNVIADLATKLMGGESSSPVGGGGHSPSGGGSGPGGAGGFRMPGSRAAKKVAQEIRVGWGQVTHTDAQRASAADNLPTSDQLKPDPAMADPVEFVKRYG